MKIGFHISIAQTIDKAVDRAKELSCDTFQIFTRNPRSWSFKELGEEEAEDFRLKRLRAGFDQVFGHMPYIQNLSSPNDDIYSRSVKSLKIELSRCSTLGIPCLVTHLGSHLGTGLDQGIKRLTEALDEALSNSDGSVEVLIENSSGAGGQIGSTFQELSLVLSRLENIDLVGVCVDTCHAFSAGYEFRTPGGLAETLSSFDRILGFDLLRLVHLNDSVGERGSKIDHHEHIGLGRIGDEGFRLVLHSELANVPLIMETPMDDRRADMDNMRKVRELAE